MLIVLKKKKFTSLMMIVIYFFSLAPGRPQFNKAAGPNLEVWNLNNNLKSTTYTVEGNICD
jgi:hypothetical protein